MSRIPLKKGQFKKDEDRLFLVNESLQEYEVLETTVFIWKLCDGHSSLSSIVKDFKTQFCLGAKTDNDFGQILKKRIIELADMGLVEISQISSTSFTHHD